MMSLILSKVEDGLGWVVGLHHNREEKYADVSFFKY